MQVADCQCNQLSCPALISTDHSGQHSQISQRCSDDTYILEITNSHLRLKASSVGEKSCLVL